MFRKTWGQPTPLILFFPALVLLVVLVLPVSSFLIHGFSKELLTYSASEMFSLWGFTLWQAFLSSLLSAAVGIALAVMWNEENFFWRSWMWRLAPVCFALPSLLVSLAVLSLWGRHGWFGGILESQGISIYGWPGVLLAHVFLNSPVFFRVVGQGLAVRDRRPELAALALGASRLRIFFTITLRGVFSAWAGSWLLTFLACANSFLVVLLLGGGPAFSTIEVAIFQAVKVDFNWSLASAWVWIQVVTTSVLSFLYLKTRKIRRTVPSGWILSVFKTRSPKSRWVVLLLGTILFLVVLICPLLGLIAEGIAGLGLLDFHELISPVITSLILAILMATFNLLLAYPLAHYERHSQKGVFRMLSGLGGVLPGFFSALVLTAAFLFCYPGITWDLGLGGVILLQGVLSLPLTFQILRSSFHSIDDRHFISARALGAWGLTLFREVEWPVLRKSVLSAFLFSFVLSLGEVSTLLVLAPSGVQTLSLLIFRKMQRYAFDEASGLAALLVILIAVIFLGLDRSEEGVNRAI